MRKYFVGVVTAVFGFALIFSNVSLVRAQDTETEEFTLEEITVTAQKREENSQKVAINIETITGDELTENGVTTLSQALASVSGALVQETGKEISVTIRGMTNNNKPGDSVSQVGISVDGSYSNNFLTGATGFYDMQRVEVLSGPQGTLYSRNSSGGVVNMISNNPSTEGVAGSASLTMGSYHLVNTQAMINVPLDDKVAFRAAFNITAHEGYISNGTTDDDTKSTRLKLGFTPSEKLSAVLTFEYTKVGGLSGYGFVIPFEDEGDVEDPWTSTIPGSVYRNDRMSQRYFLTLNWSTPIGDVTLLPSYAKYNDDIGQQDALLVGGNGLPVTGGGPQATGTIIGFRQQVRENSQKEKSVELRIASPADFFMKYVVGVYYYNQNWFNGYTKPVTETEGLTFPGVVSWQYRKNPSKAAFGNITVPIAETFRVTAGGRYTDDKETDWSYDSTGGMTGTVFYSGPTVYKTDHFDYKLGAEYDLGANSMLWVDYSTGYKQGFRGNAAQTLKSYQLGEKSRFFGQKLQVNATAYYYDYQNFQVDAGSQTVNGVDYMGTGYAMADLYGLDLSTDYIITSQDVINLSVSYLDAEVSSATIKYETMAGDALPSVVMTSNLPALNASPKYTITASYEHRFDLNSGASITSRIEPRYQTEKTLQFQPTGSVPAGMDKNKINTEPSHIMVNASLNYIDASGKWTLNGYVKNATNHAEKTGFYLGVDYLQIGSPRTYGAILSVRF